MIFRKSTHKVAHRDDLLRVKTYSRLVEYNDLRVADKSLRDTHSLLVTLREVFDKPRLHLSELNDRDDLIEVSASVELAPLEVVYEIQIFRNRHIGIKWRLLGQKSYVFLSLYRMLGYVHTVYIYLARGSREISRKDIHSGTLTRTVRSEQTDYLTLADLKRDVADGIIRAKALNKIFYFDHRVTLVLFGLPFAVLLDI